MPKSKECFYCGLPFEGHDHSDCGQDFDYEKDRPNLSADDDEEDEEVAA